MKEPKLSRTVYGPSVCVSWARICKPLKRSQEPIPSLAGTKTLFDVPTSQAIHWLPESISGLIKRLQIWALEWRGYKDNLFRIYVKLLQDEQLEFFYQYCGWFLPRKFQLFSLLNATYVKPASHFVIIKIKLFLEGWVMFLAISTIQACVYSVHT